MAEYIQVAEEEGEEPMEIPVEDDGTLLLSTLSAQFPGSCGLRFRNPESGAFRGVRVHEGRLYPPDSSNGWMDTPFVAVFPKHRDQTDSAGDNKRKGDQIVDNPIPKTKKLENIKCTDLIVLGLNYETTDETMKEYFSNFGRTVLCEIKKRQDTQKSRGFGFVKFSDYSVQRQVLGQRHEIDGRMCDVKIPASKESDERSRRVFVGRVPETMKAEDLKVYFSQYGDVNDVFMPKPYRPFAFVTFEDPEVAQSLCGEDHTVCEVSLLVRSAAPRQDDLEDESYPSHDVNRDKVITNGSDLCSCTDSYSLPQQGFLRPCSVVLSELPVTALSCISPGVAHPYSVVLTVTKDHTDSNISSSSISTKPCSVVMSNLLNNGSRSVHVQSTCIRPCSVVLADLVACRNICLFDRHCGILRPCSVVLFDCLRNKAQLLPCYVLLSDCLSSPQSGSSESDHIENMEPSHCSEQSQPLYDTWRPPTAAPVHSTQSLLHAQAYLTQPSIVLIDYALSIKHNED